MVGLPARADGPGTRGKVRHMATIALSEPTRGARPGHVPGNKGKRYPAEVLTDAEVQALIASCSRAPTGQRNRAMIVVMWRSGLRVGEVLALAPKDVDLERGAITVLRGKGGRRRTVGIDPQALAVIERWIATRQAVALQRGWKPSLHPLFCTMKGTAVRAPYVRELLHRLGARAGIAKRVHPHGLRHSCAFALAMEGVPVPLIQRQLGHVHLNTTERYVSHVAPAQLIWAMQAREWTPPPELLEG